MSDPNAIYAAFFFISLLAFLLLFYGPYQELVIARARQHMFNSRNELFRMAASGSVSFEDEVYVTMRSDIQKMIRYCHAVSWVRLIVSHLLWKEYSSREEAERLLVL